jgi:phospholipid transport system substrate-binding protein
MVRLRFPILVLVLFCSFVLLTSFSVQAEEPKGPQAQLQVSIEHFLDVLNDPELKKPGQEEVRRQKVIKIAFSQFDMPRMAMLCLGRGWKKLSPEERVEFTELFKKLLTKSYISLIDNYSGEKVVFTREEVKGRKAEVRSKVVSSNRETPIFYKLKREPDGRWLIYDVIIENVSLVRNYRSQFAPLMRKKGYVGLREQMLKKIKENKTEEDKKNG